MQISIQETWAILQRLVKISKQDVRKYKKIIINTPEWMPPEQQEHIKRNAIDAYLFLEWTKENFPT